MGVGTEDAIGLEPARRGGTAGSGTSPGPQRGKVLSGPPLKAA